MRSAVLAATLLAGCAGPPHVRTTTRPAPPACDGAGDDVRLAAPLDSSAPIVVLDETHLHGWGVPQPTIAIWADGHVVFTRKIREDGNDWEALEAEIPPAIATRLAAEVFDLLETLSWHVRVGPDTDGGQITTITVRVGDRWRSVELYSAFRDDFYRVPTPLTEAPKPGPKPDATGGIPFGGSDALEEPPPPRFAAAYRRLVDSLPRDGKRFVPYEYDALLTAPQYPDQPPPVPWPSDLPAPPGDLRPASCDPIETEGCAHPLGLQHRAAALRFREAQDAAKRRYVLVNGQVFDVRIRSRYQGESTKDAVVECATELARRAR